MVSVDEKKRRGLLSLPCFCCDSFWPSAKVHRARESEHSFPLFPVFSVEKTAEVFPSPHKCNTKKVVCFGIAFLHCPFQLPRVGTSFGYEEKAASLASDGRPSPLVRPSSPLVVTLRGTQKWSAASGPRGENGAGRHFLPLAPLHFAFSFLFFLLLRRFGAAATLLADGHVQSQERGEGAVQAVDARAIPLGLPAPPLWHCPLWRPLRPRACLHEVGQAERQAGQD